MAHWRDSDRPGLADIQQLKRGCARMARWSLRTSRCRALLLVCGIAGVALVAYWLTLAPDLTWAHWGADGGDFVTAALVGRVPHPPGFPLYMVFADGFIRLPWGAPAWRLNFLSALLAAGAVAGLALTLLRWGLSPLITVAVSLSLAFAPLFWSQAIITEVYTAAAFWVAWMLYLWTVLRMDKAAPPLLWAVAGLLWGAGVATHLTLVFLFPLWMRARGRARVALLAGLLVGLLPYGLLPLRGPWPQPWGDLRTLAGWGDFVSARLYWGYAFGMAFRYLPQRLLAWGGLLARQATPVGLVLGLVGLHQCWERNRSAALEMLLAVGLGSLYAVGYNSADSLVYLVPLLPVMALWLGQGLAWAIQRGLPQGVGLLLPLILLLWQGPALRLQSGGEARAWAEAVLDQAPSRAVLVTAQDAHTFALWYAQEGLGLRPDVWVVDRDLWATAAYREVWALRLGFPVAQLSELGGDRPLCRVEDDDDLMCSDD